MTVAVPVVPLAPGVPPVNRPSGFLQVANQVSLAIADVALLFGQQAQWGIYDLNFKPVITPTNFLSWGIKHDWQVADYPIEQGGYATYDRVDTAPEVRIKLSFKGNPSQRNQFLKQLQIMCGSTLSASSAPSQLFRLRVPETTFANLWAVTHYDYHRDDRGGITLLTIDLWFQSVRLLGQAPTPRQPNGAVQFNGGSLLSQLASAVSPVTNFLGSTAVSLGQTVSGLTTQLFSFGSSALSGVAGTLSDMASGVISLASPLAAGSVLTSLVPISLENLGFALTAMGPQLSLATSLVSGFPAALAGPALSSLSSIAPSVGALAEQTFDTASNLIAGGTGALSTLPLNIPVGSALGQALDATSGPVTIGNVTFGPIFPGKVQ